MPQDVLLGISNVVPEVTCINNALEHNGDDEAPGVRSEANRHAMKSLLLIPRRSQEFVKVGEEVLEKTPLQPQNRSCLHDYSLVDLTCALLKLELLLPVGGQPAVASQICVMPYLPQALS